MLISCGRVLMLMLSRAILRFVVEPNRVTALIVGYFASNIVEQCVLSSRNYNTLCRDYNLVAVDYPDFVVYSDWGYSNLIVFAGVARFADKGVLDTQIAGNLRGPGAYSFVVARTVGVLVVGCVVGWFYAECYFGSGYSSIHLVLNIYLYYCF